MEFVVGNKVKVRDEVLSKMESSPFAKMCCSEGKVVWTGTNYTKILFSNSVIQWFTNRSIQLIKNQQLYFDLV